MKEYLMVFSHSTRGAHQFFFQAENDDDAKKRAIARLESSPMIRMTYELFEVRNVTDYDMWVRESGK